MTWTGIGGLMVEVRDRTKEAFQRGRRRAAGLVLAGPSAGPRRRRGPGPGGAAARLPVVWDAEAGQAAGPWLKSILVNVFRDQLRRQARSPEELPVEQVEDFSLYQTLVEQDPLPYSDTLHHDYLRAFGNEDVREVLLRLPSSTGRPWCCGTWTDSPPKRSPACSTFPWDGPGPAASGSQAVRTRAVGVRPGDRILLRGDVQ